MIPNISLNSTTRVGVYVLLLLAGVLALYLAQSVIIPLLVALLLAAVLGPAAVWLQQALKVRWSIACLLVIFLLILFNVLIGMVFALAVSRLAANLPNPADDKGVKELYLKFRDRLQQVAPWELDEEAFPKAPKEARDVRLIQYIGDAAPRMAQVTAGYFGSWAWQATIILFVLLFVLLEGRMLARRVVAIFGPSPEVQGRATEVLLAIAGQVRTYLVYRTILNIGLALVMGFIWWVTGVSQWLTWAVLLSILDYIPYLGPIVAGGPPLADAFISSGAGTAVLVLILYIVAITLESYFFFPLLLGRSMDLNATTVMLACLFWDLVWGTTGLFLAMPIMAGIKELLYHVPEGRAWADLMSTSDESSRPPVQVKDEPNGTVNGSLPATKELQREVE